MQLCWAHEARAKTPALLTPLLLLRHYPKVASVPLRMCAGRMLPIVVRMWCICCSPLVAQVPLLLPSAASLMRAGVLLVELPAGFDAEGVGLSDWQWGGFSEQAVVFSQTAALLYCWRPAEQFCAPSRGTLSLPGCLKAALAVPVHPPLR